MHEPMLSVLLPVHDGEAHLGAAMESILAQSFEDFELIVLDDGSTDGSADIVRAHDDPRIRLVMNEENLRLAKTLNRGLGLARGRYVARMDADDRSRPRRFEKQIDFLDRHRDVGVCGTWLRTFGTEREIWKVPTTHDEIRVNMLFRSSLLHPTVMMRRALFASEDVAYDEDLEFVQDYALWMDLADRTRFANLPEILLDYRVENRSPRRRKIKTRQEEIARALRRRWIGALGIDADEKELEIHDRLARSDYEASEAFLRRTADWLLKILRINETRRFAADDACRRILTAELYNVCCALIDRVDTTTHFSRFLRESGSTRPILQVKLLLKRLVPFLRR